MATAAPPPPKKPNLVIAQKRVKTKTMDGLKNARMRPARPTYFMLCIGNAQSLTYLAPVVGASHKTMLRPLMGADTGLKYHRGQCIFEKGYYTFVGPTVSAGMRRKLEQGLIALTGRRWPTRVRRGEVEEKGQSSAELPA